MNAITVSETAVEAVAAEIEDNAPGITYLSSGAKEIPLSRLVPSPANVRRFNAAVNVGELADSIEAHGLIQNLTVRKAKRGNKYEVVAGSRRLAALTLLGVTTRKWRICPTFKNVSGIQVGLTVDVVAFSALRAS